MIDQPAGQEVAGCEARMPRTDDDRGETLDGSAFPVIAAS
jgi:hypothetical protein